MENQTVAKLILKRIEELKLTRREVAERMGYRRIDHGMNKLNNILNGSILTGDQSKRLSFSLGVDVNVLLQIMNDEKKQQELKNDKIGRNNFIPCLYAICENRRPSSIVIGNIVDYKRYIYLEKAFLQSSLKGQIIRSKRKIIKHFKKNNGIIPTFGNIMHYVLHLYYDDNKEDVLILDTSGNRISKEFGDIEVFQGKPNGLYLG